MISLKRELDGGACRASVVEAVVTYIKYDNTAKHYYTFE